MGTPFKVGTVHCDKHEKLREKYDVVSFPTILWIPSEGPTVIYNGLIEHSGLLEFGIAQAANSKPAMKPIVAEGADQPAPAQQVELRPPGEITQLDDIEQLPALLRRQRTERLVVSWFAPWCGRCKQFANEFLIVATAFAEVPNVRFVNLTTDGSGSLNVYFDVRTFPTVVFFEANEQALVETPQGFKYPNAPVAISLVQFMNRKLRTFKLPDGTDAKEPEQVALAAGGSEADPPAAIFQKAELTKPANYP